MSNPRKIVLTIDVEDWFQVRNMRGSYTRDQWDGCENRLNIGLDFILEELDARGIHATFFILGWIAEKHPEEVQKIVRAGHEIASHGYSHKGLDELTPEEFDQDLRRSLQSLESLCGRKINGFRAPSFSLTERTWWAFDILKKNQIAFDSSVYPVRHPNYGIPSFSKDPQRVAGVVEIPLTTCRVGGMDVPISGGGYFRLYPYSLTRRLLTQTLRERSAIMYFHPWEFDPEPPQAKGLSPSQRFRHYVGLKANRSKFHHLLKDFEFCTMDEFLSEKGFAVPRCE